MTWKLTLTERDAMPSAMPRLPHENPDAQKYARKDSQGAFPNEEKQQVRKAFRVEKRKVANAKKKLLKDA